MPAYSHQTDRQLEALELSFQRRSLYNVGRKVLRNGIQSLRSLIKPKEKMTASEWAEEYGFLSRESNSMPGKVTLYGYQRELLDAMSDPEVEQVSVLKAARVGYTRLVTLALGYFIEHDPSPIMFAQPTVGDVEDFSGTEVMPMLRDTEALKPLRRTIQRGERQDTLTDFQFRNGSALKLRGAASDDAFRRVSTRINIGDEIDGDGWSSEKKGSQGDKLRLFRTRGETFWNSKLIVGSTPLWHHSSRIYREWLKSDQRRYFVPCPHCGEMQYLEFGGKDVDHGLKWKTNDEGYVTDAWYVCKHNGCVIEEFHKRSMDANGEWRPTATPKTPGHRGYHLWTGMSLFPKAGWKFIAQDFMEAAKKPELLQPFVNLRLGEPYEEREDLTPEFNVEEAKNNVEVYPAEVPDDVLVLTAGVDVQTGSEKTTKKEKSARIEVSIWGWGYGEESWLISHHIIAGEMSDPETQRQLDHLLQTPLRKRDGTELIIQAAGVDMGGHYTEAVKAYANSRIRRNIWAVKGRNLAKGTRSGSVWPRLPSKKKRDQFFMLDTQLAKDIIGRRFKIEHPGPGFIHFPAGTEDRYFDGLASEVRMKMGQGYHWQKPNAKAYGEPLDCYVYAYAVLQGLKLISKRWRALDQAPSKAELEAQAQKTEETVTEINSDETTLCEKDDHPLRVIPAPKAPAPTTKRRRPVAKSNFLRR